MKELCPCPRVKEKEEEKLLGMRDALESPIRMPERDPSRNGAGGSAHLKKGACPDHVDGCCCSISVAAGKKGITA